MAYLFDTDAISELLKKAPLPTYVKWVAGLKREDQFTSSIVICLHFERIPDLKICHVLSDAKSAIRG